MTDPGAAPWKQEIREAARTFDWRRVTATSESYIGHLRSSASPASRADVEDILQTLRENLRYDDLVAVADAALGHGLDDVVVWRHYAQALVDDRRPAAALVLFADIVDSATSDDAEKVEARGGIGRSYKQLFVVTSDSGRRAEFLRRALDSYLTAYREDRRRFWHGINAAALLARADRDGVPVPGTDEPGTTARRLANEILATVEAFPPGDAWVGATACEALIALGRHEQAIRRGNAFVTDPATSAFMIASLLRQLLEIWQLDTTGPPGDVLLPVLRSSLLSRRGGDVAVESRDVRATRLAEAPDARLEKVLGNDRYQSLTWYLNGLVRCRAVAQIQDTSANGIGTGFLVRGADLHPALPDQVLVTNGHVIPEDLHPADAVVVFHGLTGDPGHRREFGVSRRWWYRPSAGSNLDTTLLELDGRPDDVTPIPLARALPAQGVQRRTYIIGHPRGLSQPQFSLQDNLLLDYDDMRIHYRSPTEGGSSGSPVFDDQWRLIGLHHAGGFEMPRLNSHGGTYAANEAVRLQAIIEALRADPPVSQDIS